MQLGVPPNWLTAPFGISVWGEADSKQTRRTLDYRIRDPVLAKYFADFDENNIKTAIANKQTWFTTNLSDEMIRATYSPTLRVDNSKSGFDPILHTKVNTGEDRTVQVGLYKRTPEGALVYTQGTVGDIQKQSQVIPIIEPTSIWFLSKSWGMSVTTTSVLINHDIVRETVQDKFDFGN